LEILSEKSYVSKKKEEGEKVDETVSKDTENGISRKTTTG